MPIAVVTDSAACLTRSLAQDHGIDVVALHTHTDQTGASTTSRPSIEELAQAYRSAARRSREVLALHLSASLSGTLDNARLAAQQVNADEEAHVAVIDSGTCSGALALAALTAPPWPTSPRPAPTSTSSSTASATWPAPAASTGPPPDSAESWASAPSSRSPPQASGPSRPCEEPHGPARASSTTPSTPPEAPPCQGRAPRPGPCAWPSRARTPLPSTSSPRSCAQPSMRPGPSPSRP